jgi:hypothetical protein
MSDIGNEIEAIFARDAAVIRKHGIRPVVFIAFDPPAEARDATRRRDDAAVLAAIKTPQR